MSNLDVTKTVVNFVVGAGVTKIVNDIITSTSAPANVYQKVTVFSGSVVLGLMASDASKVYTNAKIDSCIKSWHDFRNTVKEDQK